MWDNNILSEDTPDKLRDTVLYILGINCALQAGMNIIICVGQEVAHPHN